MPDSARPWLSLEPTRRSDGIRRPEAFNRTTLTPLADRLKSALRALREVRTITSEIPPCPRPPAAIRIAGAASLC